KVTYSVYEGIANVPTIKHDGGSAKPAVTVFRDEDDTRATIVFVEKNADMTMASDSADVIYIKGNASHDADNGKSYTTALGDFWEYDAFRSGDEIVIRANEPINVDTVIYGPVYNEKDI